MIPYVISWVDRGTIKGCSLNFATLKPFTKPTAAPTPNTIRSTTGMGIADVMLGNTLNTVVSKEAEIHAARPTTRPAEISVPVSTIQPPIPRAMGSFAAVREIIFTIEERLMNLGCFTVMKMIAMAMMIYIALFKIRSPIFLCWSFLESALNSCALDVALLSATVHSSYPYANFAARAMISSCVVVLASTSPASCPPDITRIRSQTPKSSGISEETISTVFPSLARLRISW